MIDIHCHILDGLDDGPQSLDESVELCGKLKEAGISSIIATPHYMIGDGYAPTPETIKSKMDNLKGVLKEKNIDLNIYSGMEVFADHEIADGIENGEILTLNNTKYVLIEFPMDIVLKQASNLVFLY